MSLSMRFSRRPKPAPVPEPTSQDCGFWFSRIEDEPYIGDLEAYKMDKATRASVEYAGFLAGASMSHLSGANHMSLASFASMGSGAHMSQDLNKSFAQGQAYFNALQNLPPELTWRQWFYRNRFIIIAVVYGVLAVVAISVFTVPVVLLEGRVQECPVAAFRVVDVSCSAETEGWCLELEVSAITPDENRVTGTLLGFDSVEAANGQSQGSISCITSNCAQTFGEIDEPNPETECGLFLADAGKTFSELTDGEKQGCLALGTLENCVFLSADDTILYRMYYSNIFSKVGNEDIITNPQGPSQNIVVISSSVIGSIFFILVIVAVFKKRTFPGQRIPQSEEKEDPPQPVIIDGVLSHPKPMPATRAEAQQQMHKKLRDKLM